MIKSKWGFTLIELLIVVLIIGILTAVAVPMYKHATLKSQFSTVMPPTKSLAEAQEVFYLNNGEYAEDKEELDVSVPDTAQTTVTVSDKRNYKFVKGHHTGVPGANYIVYQKNSKRFADNVHCEAAKTDDAAQWLCEKGLGGTPIPGSISGANYLTYLLSGDAGTDRFIREDCPAGAYDNNGVCTWTPSGHYADEGELIACPIGQYQANERQTSCNTCPQGMYNTAEGSTMCLSCQPGTYLAAPGATSCTKCPIGQYQAHERQTSCDTCPRGMYNTTEGSSGCTSCQPGTYLAAPGATSCTKCPIGQYQAHERQTSCDTCPRGMYNTAEGSSGCTSCPSGQTNNADHTGCVPI